MNLILLFASHCRFLCESYSDLQELQSHFHEFHFSLHPDYVCLSHFCLYGLRAGYLLPPAGGIGESVQFCVCTLTDCLDTSSGWQYRGV